MTGLLILAGCAIYEVIPEHLEGEVHKDVQLERVEKAPDAYPIRGKPSSGEAKFWTPPAGGDNMKVEILQLPWERSSRSSVQ